MKTFYLERLRKLADKLCTMDPRKFRLSDWALKVNFRHNIAEVGCAIGVAASMPEFRKRGFRLYQTTSEWDYDFDGDNFSRNLGPYYKGYTDWDAVCEFFGLSEAEAAHLFFYDSYRYGVNTKPLTVAKRIYNFVDKKYSEKEGVWTHTVELVNYR